MFHFDSSSLTLDWSIVAKLSVQDLRVFLIGYSDGVYQMPKLKIF